jgi:hypothetical protein
MPNLAYYESWYDGKATFLDRKRAVKQKMKVEPSSGNVFADLGFPHPEEALLKAELAGRILELVMVRQINRSAA